MAAIPARPLLPVGLPDGRGRLAPAARSARSTSSCRVCGAVTRQGWHHFASLVAIVVLMARGVTAFRAVFWATVLAVAASFLRRDTALVAARLARRAGGRRRAACCRSSPPPPPPASSSASSR